MEKIKSLYELAEVEIVVFEFSDIVTTSIIDTEDRNEQTQAPSYGDWDVGGWK